MRQRRVMAIMMAGMLCVSTALTGCAKAPGKEQTEAQAMEPAPVTLYLTRHGKTMLNTTGRMQGWCDSPLTEDGAAVAEKLGRGLKKAGITFDAVYTSDSGRAMETAELILKNNGQPEVSLQRNPKVREVCYGIYEGAMPAEAYTPAAKALGYDSVDAMMGAVMGGKLKIEEAVTAMAETDESKTAETWETAQKRVMDGIREIAGEAAERGQKQVLVVSHGMAISAAVAAIDPDAVAGELGNASITKIIYDNGMFTVESVNDMSYIEE